ncbi:hypothetical protein ZIOFF_027221 [Zingiber officinale]|uniref:F-box/LRR-repeat protein 15/At3g58940/PEG3-like LRR domain-containing protein n=1 Tax=Zingiber officinale TaxID=94328 RepID=A0A8J5GZT8_ZINOF|nr:hypothetical protein ZIOFF_027221 [Zingiber officinale]
MDNLSISRRRFRRHLQSELGGRRLPEWRHVWTSVPVIDFSYLPLKSSIIDRFFASRGGDSVSRLHVTGLRRVDRENVVYKLVEYAKSHDARHVTLLDFFFEQCRLSLFDLLFDWPSLVSLDLRVVGCKSRTLSKCIFRLSNLKTLSLALPENTIRNESLAKLLSGCPVLEELKLNADYLWDDELIQIEAPNLLRLTLIPTPTNLQINCQKLEYLRLNPDFSFMYLHVEAPSLTSVRLYNIWRFRTFAHSVCDVTAVAIILSDECLSSFTPKFLARWCDEDFDKWEKSLSSSINEPLEHLERVSVNMKSKRIRSAFLKTLLERVPTWDRVAVSY